MMTENEAGIAVPVTFASKEQAEECAADNEMLWTPDKFRARPCKLANAAMKEPTT